MSEAGVDVKALVQEIELDVARRRQAGEYPPALLRRLETAFRTGGSALRPEDLAYISSSRPVTSGGIRGTVKRLIQRAIAWYVRPVAEDQSRFNVVILHELRALQDRIEKLERGQ